MRNINRTVETWEFEHKGNGIVRDTRKGGSMNVLWCLLIGALIVVWPLAAVWALNSLFGLAIPYDFTSWLAMFVVMVVLACGRAERRKL